MNRFLPIAIAALIVVAGAAYWLAQNNSASGTSLSAVQQTGDEVNTDTAQPDNAGSIAEMVLGDANAPVTVIEYASFTCPHCATFHNNTFPQIKANYIDTGKVKFVFREVYFDRFGLWASMVARCAGPDRFFGMTELFFKGQKEWTQGDPVAIADAIRKVGRLAGLQEENLKACMQDEKTAQALISWYQKNAEADGISSTPSFVINGKKYGSMDYGEMKPVIDGLL